MRAWNCHGLSTEKGMCPLGILFRDRETNGGAPWNEEHVNVLLHEMNGSVENFVGANQVDCPPRICPLNEHNFTLFSENVKPFTLNDTIVNIWAKVHEVILYANVLMSLQ